MAAPRQARAEIACACGSVGFVLDGDPILAAECHCRSCREAGERLAALPGAAPIREANGGTRFVLWRKDRVRALRGTEHLRSFRLKPEAATERAVAACCNAPVHLTFKGGHWLSLYAARWPEGTAPPPELRTMVRDAPDGAALPDDIPNADTQTLGFYAKLFGAWVRMGFRNPNVTEVREEIDA